MTAAQRISRADWREWFWHLWTTVVRGAAEGADAAMNAATAGVAAAGVDAAISDIAHINIAMLWTIAAGAALVAALRASIRFLKDNPVPTGDEVPDDS